MISNIATKKTEFFFLTKKHALNTINFVYQTSFDIKKNKITLTSNYISFSRKYFFYEFIYLKLKYTSFQCFDIDFKNVTCSSDVHCISCLALSIPSLVPVIRIRSDPSSAFGMEILVDVLNSNS